MAVFCRGIFWRARSPRHGQQLPCFCNYSAYLPAGYPYETSPALSPLPTLLLVTKDTPCDWGKRAKRETQVNIGQVIRPTGASRGLSQGDMKRRTGCCAAIFPVEMATPCLRWNPGEDRRSHEISLADFFPARKRRGIKKPRRCWANFAGRNPLPGGRSKLQHHAFEGDKRLVLAMIRKHGMLVPRRPAHRARRPVLRRLRCKP